MAILVTIREKITGAVLACGELGPQVIKYDRAWYFLPDMVERGCLQHTARTATCSIKGTSRWVDYVGPDGRIVHKVAWVYENPNPGSELIAGRYGFYMGNRGATRQDP